jgi:hypothetical protein
MKLLLDSNASTEIPISCSSLRIIRQVSFSFEDIHSAVCVVMIDASRCPSLNSWSNWFNFCSTASWDELPRHRLANGLRPYRSSPHPSQKWRATYHIKTVNIPAFEINLNLNPAISSVCHPTRSHTLCVLLSNTLYFSTKASKSANTSRHPIIIVDKPASREFDCEYLVRFSSASRSTACSESTSDATFLKPSEADLHNL